MCRLTVLKNMRTKVDRVINITEIVETEVEFPKYTMDFLSYCKHYSEDHCVAINIIGDTFASVLVTHNNKGHNLFDEEISEVEFNLVKAKALAMLIPELGPTEEEETIWQRNERQQKQKETI